MNLPNTLALLSLLLAAPTQAAIGGGAALTAPFAWGVGANVEIQPYGVLLGLEAGQVPDFFAAIQEQIASGNGASKIQGTLARQAMTNTGVVQLRAGYKPLPKLGLELWAGYGLGFFGGGRLTREQMQEATGMPLQSTATALSTGVVTTLHHSVHGMVAWAFQGERVFTRVAVGYLAVIASSSSVTAAGASAQFKQTLENAMNASVTKYLRMPVVHLTVGYRL